MLKATQPSVVEKSRVLATEPVFLRPWNGPRVVHEMVSCGMSIKREAI